MHAAHASTHGGVNACLRARCVCMHVSTHMCMCVRMRVHTQCAIGGRIALMHELKNACMHACMHVAFVCCACNACIVCRWCMYVCICERIYVWCLFVCMGFMFAFVCVFIYVRRACMRHMHPWDEWRHVSMYVYICIYNVIFVTSIFTFIFMFCRCICSCFCICIYIYIDVDVDVYIYYLHL